MESGFRDAFDGLDWSDSKGAHLEIANILSRECIRSSMLSVLARARDQDVAFLAQRSHETATHYKWFVGAADDWRWQAWVHQYKEPHQAMLGYANTPHNHRYWFTSHILSGGFQNVTYATPDANLSLSNVQTLTAGDSYLISPECVHSLKSIMPRTTTLIVRGRAKRSYSLEYREGGKVIRHYPMRTHLVAFREFLASMNRS